MKLALGTVQLGMDYGMVGAGGVPAPDAVQEILALAVQHGVRVLDTAPAYGASEERLGEFLPPEAELRIVTKTPALLSRLPPREIGPAIHTSLQRSLRRLRRPRVYGLLVHSAEDLRGEGAGAVYDALRELRDSGSVTRIGVSAYGAADLDALSPRHALDLVQVPVSVLDQRLLRSGHLERLHGSGVEVHARSVFLQGALLAGPLVLPGFLGDLRDQVARFHEHARDRGTTPLKAALAFALTREWVDQVVVGVDGVTQLREVLAAAKDPVCDASFEELHFDREELLNPSLWQDQR